MAAPDTIQVFVPLKVRKKKRAAQNPAARRLPTQRGQHTRPAYPARHRPCVGLEAADGSG